MGAFFTIGEQKIRPGTYLRYENTGGPTEGVVASGITAAVFRASWGPLNEVVEIPFNTPGDIQKYFAADDNSANFSGIAELQLKAAKSVKCVRVGTGGTKATLNLKDTAGSPADVITVTAKYVGNRALTVTVKDSLTDSSKREFIVYEGTKELQKVEFTKGGAEVDSLIAALNAVGSSWVTLTKITSGTGLLASATQSALTGGTNPNVTNADYSTAFTALEAHEWDVISIDSNDAALNTLLAGYVNRIFSDGKMSRCAVGELTSVAFATRKANAAAFNSFLTHYAINGFKINGVAHEGFRAAAVLAGMVAAGPSNNSMTHQVIQGATEIVGILTGPEINQAIQSGAIVFTANSNGQIWTEYGINTLVTLSADQDAGWKKIRRVSTRMELMKRSVAISDPLVGNVDNDSNGRATIIAAVQGVINSMVREGKLISGLIYEDPDNAPSGDSAWFKLAIDDLDSAEKLYFTFGFRFTAV